jgi:hypothetical protein
MYGCTDERRMRRRTRRRTTKRRGGGWTLDGWELGEGEERIREKQFRLRQIEALAVDCCWCILAIEHSKYNFP